MADFPVRNIWEKARFILLIFDVCQGHGSVALDQVVTYKERVWRLARGAGLQMETSAGCHLSSTVGSGTSNERFVECYDKTCRYVKRALNSFLHFYGSKCTT